MIFLVVKRSEKVGSIFLTIWQTLSSRHYAYILVSLEIGQKNKEIFDPFNPERSFSPIFAAHNNPTANGATAPLPLAATATTTTNEASHSSRPHSNASANSGVTPVSSIQNSDPTGSLPTTTGLPTLLPQLEKKTPPPGMPTPAGPPGLSGSVTGLFNSVRYTHRM